MPNDFGTHQRSNSSGFDHASNTKRAGASNDRVTTTSRSDFRSTFVTFFIRARSPSLLPSIRLLLPLQFLDDLVELAEALVPELVIPLDPRRHFLETASAD